MKECSGKKVLIVKVAQIDPLDSFGQKIDQVDSNMGYGIVLHVQEELHQSTLIFRMRVASSVLNKT